MLFIRSLTVGLLLLLAGYTTVQAQKSRSAYLITATSDTLQGEILQESTARMVYAVQFRQQDNEFKTYAAADVKGYGLGDSLRYEARQVLVDEKTQSIFLQVIVDGPAKLYYAQNFHPSYEYFLQKQQQPVVPLHKSYYTGTLAALLQDCAALKNQKYRYGLSGLASQVHAYNQCLYADQKSDVMLKPSKVVSTWGVRVAAHTFQLNYPSEIGAPENHTFSWTPGLTTGLFLNFGFTGKRFSFQPELLYTSRKAKSVYQHSQPYFTYESVVALEAHYLQLPVLLKYKFNQGTWQPYLNAGFNYSLALSKEFNKSVSYYEDKVEMALDGYTLGYIAGAGIQRNALSLEARFSRDVANSNYIFKEMHFSTWQLAFGIRF